MGNKPGKDESFRNRSLSRLSFIEHEKKEISTPKLKKTNLRKSKAIGSNQNLSKIKKSKSLIKSSKLFKEKINLSFIKKKEEKNYNFEDSIEFCQDFAKIFYVKNLNPCLSSQSNFFNKNNSDILNEDNFRFKKLSRTFINLEKNNLAIKTFCTENFKNEIQYFIDILKRKNKKVVKNESEKNFFLNAKKKKGKKDLFAFQKNIIEKIEAKKKINNFEKRNFEKIKTQTKSRSFSNNSKESNSNTRGFKITNGHVFSFQNELSKKKKMVEKNNFKENCIIEESEENSVKKIDNFDINNYKNLDLISQKKLEKFLNKKNFVGKKKEDYDFEENENFRISKERDFKGTDDYESEREKYFEENINYQKRKYRDYKKYEIQKKNRDSVEDENMEIISDKDLNNFFLKNKNMITEEKIKDFYKRKQDNENNYERNEELEDYEKNDFRNKKDFQKEKLDVFLMKRENKNKEKYQELINQEKKLLQEEKKIIKNKNRKKFNSVGKFKTKTITVNLEDLQKKKKNHNKIKRKTSISNKNYKNKKKFFDTVFEDSNKNSKKKILANLGKKNYTKSSYKNIFEKKKSILNHLNKKKNFDPVKYLQGDSNHQIYNFPKNKKFFEFLNKTKKSENNQKEDILKKFRESGKKRKNRSKKSSNQNSDQNSNRNSLNIEHDSIEYEIYRNIIGDYKNPEISKKKYRNDIFEKNNEEPFYEKKEKNNFYEKQKNENEYFERNNKNDFYDKIQEFGNLKKEKNYYGKNKEYAVLNKNISSDKNYSEKESLKNFLRLEKKTTLSSKQSSKHHIKVDIRNLSEKVQFSLDQCFRKK